MSIARYKNYLSITMVYALRNQTKSIYIHHNDNNR
nr:MAG TPA: hypothetical protein [Caudoviricetes sp.]